MVGAPGFPAVALCGPGAAPGPASALICFSAAPRPPSLHSQQGSLGWPCSSGAGEPCDMTAMSGWLPQEGAIKEFSKATLPPPEICPPHLCSLVVFSLLQADPLPSMALPPPKQLFKSHLLPQVLPDHQVLIHRPSPRTPGPTEAIL